MNCKILNLKNRQEWKILLNGLPISQQDIYFTSEYYELYEENGDGKAQCFVFEDDANIALYPFLINSVNKLGYKLDEQYYDIQGSYGYNGVISSSYDKDFRKIFFNVFNEYCKDNNIIAEFTRFNPILGNYNFSKNFMDVKFDRKTVYLNLEQSYDDIWKYQFSSKNRNMIRKSHKSNLKIEIIKSKGVNEFYDIYNQTMERINADSCYSPPKAYFKNLLKLLDKSAYILNVIDNHHNIFCSMILFIYGKYAHYHLSGRSSTNKNNSVNNFMLDEAIKFAQTKGCELFHFGGGNTTDENDFLLRFKANFSKDKAVFYIGKKIHSRKVYNEVIKQWEERFPEKVEKYKHYLLKYRY